VLVAKGVKVITATNKISKRFRYIFEIDFALSPLDDKTIGNLYLISKHDKLRGQIEGCAVLAFGASNVVTNNYFIVCKEYFTYGDRVRWPAVAILPANPDNQGQLHSTVLVEVEFEPRSLQAMHSHCLHYFDDPWLRSVLLFKFFPQHAQDPRVFEAIAVLYRRGPRGAPEVADAVSFGTAALAPDSLNETLPDIRRVIRVLPPAPTEITANPWPQDLRPFLAVPAQHVRYLQDPERWPTNCFARAAARACATKEYTVELWRLLREVGGQRWPIVQDAAGQVYPRGFPSLAHRLLPGEVI
jgi:hypothetical protein